MPDRLDHLISTGRSPTSRAGLLAAGLMLTPDDWRAIFRAGEQALEHHADAAVDQDATSGLYAAADAAKTTHYLIEQAAEVEAADAVIFTALRDRIRAVASIAPLLVQASLQGGELVVKRTLADALDAALEELGTTEVVSSLEGAA